MAMPNWRPIRRCLTSDVINVFIYSSVRDYCQFYIYQTASIHSIYFIHHRFDYDDTFSLLSQLLNRQHFNLISVPLYSFGPDVSYLKVSPNLQLKFSDILNKKNIYIHSAFILFLFRFRCVVSVFIRLVFRPATGHFRYIDVVSIAYGGQVRSLLPFRKYRQ